MRQRHIDREVISAFVHEKLLYEDKHHNCVFVGLDDSGEAKHAHEQALVGKCMADCALYLHERTHFCGIGFHGCSIGSPNSFPCSRLCWGGKR